uniref:Uncharacterized protein n=1 Tax=Monopterus albus TaxID=43700 RepID=A0A3Q3J9X2_MONAL
MKTLKTTWTIHLNAEKGYSFTLSPLFQFDRQAPGRISTSPTLRRMRSTRRPLTSQDSVRMGSTQEEPSSAITPSPVSPPSPAHRVKSPLAASSHSDGEIYHGGQPISSSSQQRTRSLRSKTFDQDSTSTRQECSYCPCNYFLALCLFQ